MARISRIVVPEYPHHITQRGVRSMAVFESVAEREQYLAFVAEETSRFNVSILAWCLMTNHVHFIATPKTETGLARAFGEAHRRYTRMKNFSAGVRGYLFQGRFGSTVLDEKHLFAAARYIELNPVRARMVSHAWDYRWSSSRYHMHISENDPLVKERKLPAMTGNWEDFLRSGEDTEFNELRLATRTGLPAGNANFVNAIADITGRCLVSNKPGRPWKKGKNDK